MDKQDKFFNISHYHNKFILEPVEAALKAFPFEMGDGVKINLQRNAFIRGYQTAEHNIHPRLAEVERERDETRKKVLQILEENWQAQIAGYYNDEKSMTKQCRNVLIEEYKDLISIFKHQFKQQQSENNGNETTLGN